MMRFVGRFPRALALICGASLVGLFAVPVSAQESGIMLGVKAPARTLEATDGKPANLADVIGKRPVLLEFWATWCPNCKELEPKMVALHKQHGAQVAFYMVAVPINQTLARVTRYVAEHKYPFPMLWDKDGRLAEDYEVPATSYVVLIDRTGKVVYTGVGGSQDLESAIKKVL
jgi:thiol-disulfide isomerase/thioredoxin